jgi:AcrR family transcriptional regulator
MQSQKTDRRVQRTRQLMRDALASLILEKGYDNVTVQDIIDRANIGRSTFYAHFQDKEDLFLRGVAEIAYGDDLQKTVTREMEHRQQAGPSETISVVPMFAHVKANELLHKAMFAKNKENSLLNKGTAFLFANINSQLTQFAKGKQTSVPIPVMAQFLTGGLMMLTRWWQDNGMTYSPEEMDRLFQLMAMPGIRSALGLDDVGS